MFGLPVPGVRWDPVRIPGIRLVRARLVGELDLSDGARASAGLPTMALVGCDIPGPIILSRARLPSLSICFSRFRELNLRECEIDGPLDFSGATPYPDGAAKHPPAWIDARGVIINGQLDGRGAWLQAKLPFLPREVTATRERRCALWLENADIRGSVLLLKREDDPFRACGGVTMDAAHVRGDIWADNARLTAWRR